MYLYDDLWHSFNTWQTYKTFITKLSELLIIINECFCAISKISYLILRRQIKSVY